MSNPFILDVHDLLNQQVGPEHVHSSGEAPFRLGAEMFGINPGTKVELDLILTNLGEAVMAQGTVTGEASVECGRCLRQFTTDSTVKVEQVFGTSPDFITSDEESEGEEEDEAEAPELVEEEKINITQSVLNEAGLNAPFNPVCADYGLECQDSVPAPDGISEEQDDTDAPDPRWAGLAGLKEKLEERADGTQA